MTTISKLSAEVAYHTSHDYLTGLSNRDSFSRKLEHLVKHPAGGKEHYALLYIDIDRFKIINDTCGHSTADSMLVTIAGIIREFAEQPDFSARLGGDQFGLIIKSETEKSAVEKAREIHQSFHRNKIQSKGKVYAYDTSIGVSFLNGSGGSVSEFLAEADDACFLAKEEAATGSRSTTGKLTSSFSAGEKWNGFPSFRRPLMKTGLSFLYRNQASERNRHTVQQGRDPDKDARRGRKSGDACRFIPAAERYNMMAQIDRWVLSEAIRLFQQNRKNEHLSHIKQLSINLSAQSMTDDSILDFIQGVFSSSGINPESVCFEITETTTISNMAYAHEFIDQLKKTGCSFALDDFGSGFSSFNYLKTFRLTI